MARINIEEVWWSDPRRGLLGDLLGNRLFVMEVATSAWRIAQRYWEQGNLVPGHVFVSIFGYESLLKSNLAVLYEGITIDSNPTPIQQNPANPICWSLLVQQNHVYVRGSKEYLSWGVNIRQKRIEAGQKSAIRPRDSKGRLLSKSTNIQQNTNTDPTPIQQNPTQSKSPVPVPVPVPDLLKKNTLKEKIQKNPALPGFPSESQLGTDRLIATYIKAYEAKYQARPMIEGKTIGQMKNYLKYVSLDQACQMIQVYLQMENSWFEKKKHDFSTFLENQNPVSIALQTGADPDKKTIDWGKIKKDLNIQGE